MKPVNSIANCFTLGTIRAARHLQLQARTSQAPISIKTTNKRPQYPILDAIQHRMGVEQIEIAPTATLYQIVRDLRAIRTSDYQTDSLLNLKTLNIRSFKANGLNYLPTLGLRTAWGIRIATSASATTTVILASAIAVAEQFTSEGVPVFNSFREGVSNLGEMYTGLTLGITALFTLFGITIFPQNYQKYGSTFWQNIINSFKSEE